MCVSAAVGRASGWPLVRPWRLCFCEGQLKVTSSYSVDRRVSLPELSDVPEKLILLQGCVNHMAARLQRLLAFVTERTGFLAIANPPR